MVNLVHGKPFQPSILVYHALTVDKVEVGSMPYPQFPAL